MALPKKTKQPSEVFDYDIPYPTTHLPRGDTISTVDASVACITDPEDTALVLGVVAPGAGGRFSKVWLAGGTDLHDYKVSVVAQSSQGRTLETDFILKIREA